ncbi:hypothetical protein HY285_03430 [Candidatus Peregrinibacteria bacterium]|nr:hypothetical protein [Candidatus Peregrinibacteria bacterium]MBI3816567.1 hypothetical protein [Candidatus Peregrinibacteria bacterium]
MIQDDDDYGFEDMTNKDLLRVLLQEMADVRYELKQDIAALDQKLTGKIDNIDQKLSGKIDNLTLKTDQNQIAFMKNLDDIDARVRVLEATAA